MKRLPKIGPKTGASLVLFVLVAGAGWEWWSLHKLGKHRLASIPSTPMILTTCAAADTRFQVALELALDSHPE